MEAVKTILVPWDFTPLANFAVEHAVQMAKILNNSVSIIHIVKKDSEVPEALAKMEVDAQKIQDKLQMKITPVAKVGSIFDTIGEVATELNASLVIMGTHGMKGMQKYLGSWALKVIASSKVPFIIVQDSPASQEYNKVVIPINFKKENKESMAWVYFLSTMFKTKFLIFRAHSSDSKLQKATESNLYFARKYLDSKGIDYEIDEAEGNKDFAKESMDYAHRIKADLIVIMTTRDIGITDYVLGAQEQLIIANNYKIPVMCINPRPPKFSGSFSALGG